MVTRRLFPLLAAVSAAAPFAQHARAETAAIGFTSYLREGPSVRYRAIDEALSDQQVDVLSCANGWCRIAFSNASGYVAQGALVAVPATKALTLGEPRSCFVSRIAGYKGGPDVTFCTSAPH